MTSFGNEVSSLKTFNELKREISEKQIQVVDDEPSFVPEEAA